MTLGSRGRIAVFATVAAVSLFACACGSPSPPAEPSRPPSVVRAADPRDVLLITVDTLRYDATGFSGSGKVVTPLLDRLAAGGRVFTFAHAHAVVTLPSHASILTGLYPYQHGLRDNSGFVLSKETPTLASVLKASGYATAAFVSAFPLDRRFGLDTGFDVYDDEFDGYTTKTGLLAERPGELTVARAKSWWDDHAGTPRFLWVHLFAPHFPYTPPEPFATRYRSAPYYGEAAAADAQLTALLDPLLSDPTSRAIVVFTSDHGESLGEHGERYHGIFAYETTLRVPMVIRAPGRVSAGVDPEPVRHVDIVPTVLDLVGLPIPESLPGRSLLAPPPPGKDRGSYFEALDAYLNRGWAPLYGRIEETAKAIDLPLPELYFLDEDPAEARNAVSREGGRQRAIVSRIPQEARASFPREAPDSETIEKLRSLGYIASGTSAPPPARFDASTDPKNLIATDAAIEEATALQHAGDGAGAIRRLEAVLARQPRIAYVYSHLAFLHASEGRNAEAVRVLSEAVSLGIASESMKATLAKALAASGRAQAAADLLAPYGESRDPETQDALGIVSAALGNREEALARFEKAIALDPTYPTARVDLAVILIQQGRLDDARPALEQALRQNPNLPDGWNALGAVLARRGDLPGAVSAWERAVALNPKLAPALMNLATASAKLGDRAKAAAAVERLIPLVRGEQRQKAEALLRALLEGTTEASKGRPGG